MLYVIIAGIVLAAVIILFVLFARNLWKPKLSKTSSAKIQSQWTHLMALPDKHRRLMDADAVLDLTFKELGIRGSLGDKLKKMGKYLPNENDVWRAHKLRNRIAHEPGMQLSEKEVAEALHAFRQAIEAFMRR